MGKKNNSKILYGCGIGCGVIFLIAIVTVVLGYFYIANISKDFEAVENSNKKIIEKYGEISEYSIPTDSISFELALKKFIKVREEINKNDSLICKEIAEFDTLIASNIDSADIFSKIGIVEKTSKFIPVVSSYLLLRNRQLLENNLSIGEYFFCYMLAYYSFLQNNPSDGPGLILSNNSGMSFNFEDEDYNIEEIYDRRNYDRRITANKLFRKWLQNTVGTAKKADENLLDELGKCDRNHLRLPWEDDIPPLYKNILIRYKDKLVDTYESKTNFLELLNVFKKSN